MKNRIPIIALGALFLIAVIWRLANPPKPKPPGPTGSFPGWRSSAALGELGAYAVNPGGTRWAGAWNETDTRTNRLRSMMWIIDFGARTAVGHEFSAGTLVSSVTWADDNTVRALTVDSENPASADQSKIVYVDAISGDEKRSTTLDQPVARILAWGPGAKRSLAQPAGGAARAALMDESGGIIRETTTLPGGAELAGDAAVSPDGASFVFSVSEESASGGRSYYLGDAAHEQTRRIFALGDLPGRVEGIWLADAGVLVVTSSEDKFHVSVYDPALGQLRHVPRGVGAAIGSKWPGAPRAMMFTTFNGGYRLDLESGKTTRLFDYSGLGEAEDQWRQAVRDGRLYQARDGNYVSVSVNAGMVDIRELGKNGRPARDLLPRY